MWAQKRRAYGEKYGDNFPPELREYDPNVPFFGSI